MWLPPWSPRVPMISMWHLLQCFMRRHRPFRLTSTWCLHGAYLSPSSKDGEALIELSQQNDIILGGNHNLQMILYWYQGCFLDIITLSPRRGSWRHLLRQSWLSVLLTYLSMKHPCDIATISVCIKIVSKQYQWSIQQLVSSVFWCIRYQ